MYMLFVVQAPTTLSGTISPQGQIVLPASALQQGNVTVTAVNPTQVVAGMSPWHTTAPSGTALWWLQLRYCHASVGHFDLSVLCGLQLSAVFYPACVSVPPRWHSVSACYSRHSSGSGGHTGSFSRDNTRPKQSGSTFLHLCTLQMLWACEACVLSRSVVPKTGVSGQSEGGQYEGGLYLASKGGNRQSF